jgi:hypothetical protein
MLGIDVSTTDVGKNIFRVEPDCFVKIADRFVEVTLFPIGDPAIVVSTGKFRIESDRLVEVTDALVVLTLLAIGSSATPVGPSSAMRREAAGMEWIRFADVEFAACQHGYYFVYKKFDHLRCGLLVCGLRRKRQLSCS